MQPLFFLKWKDRYFAKDTFSKQEQSMIVIWKRRIWINVTLQWRDLVQCIFLVKKVNYVKYAMNTMMTQISLITLDAWFAKKSGSTISNRNYLHRTSHLLHIQFPTLPPLSDLAANQKIRNLINICISSEPNEPTYNEVEFGHSSTFQHQNTC